MALTDKVTGLASVTAVGNDGVLTCDAQAHPVPTYR